MLRCDHDETHEKRRCWHLWRGVMCFHMCFWQEQDPNGILAGGIEWHRDERVEPRTFQACDKEAGRIILICHAHLFNVQGDTESAACAHASQRKSPVGQAGSPQWFSPELLP